MVSESVVVVITYRIQPGQSGRTLSGRRAPISEVAAIGPDCGGIRIHSDPDDDTRVLLYERCSSREAYLGPHMQTPHLAAFIARVREFLAGPPAIEFWRLDDDVTRT